MSKKKKIQENTNQQSSSKMKVSIPEKEEKKTTPKKEEISSKKQRRVQRNQHLYEKEDLSMTKQQKLKLESESKEDEIDTSFLEGKKRKQKKKISDKENRDSKDQRDVAVVEKKVYPKVLLFLLCGLLLGVSSFLIYHFATFNHHKVKVVTKIKEVEVAPENIVFLGDSITDFYDLGKHYSDYKVVNSGISGNTTDDILKDMNDRVYRYNPSKVILLIGTNDLNTGKKVDEVVDNIKKIVEEIEDNRKSAEIYVEGIYPVNKEINSKIVYRRKNEDIEEVNKKLKEYCKEKKITFIDTYEVLKDDEGKLKEEYSEDGLHLNDEGYEVITEKLKSYLRK